MILYAIICFAFGLVRILSGLYEWKKQKLRWIQKRHRQYVKADDVPALTREIGIGYIIMGFGFIFNGIFALLTGEVWFGWLVFLISFIAGSIKISKALLKYNKP